MLDDMPWCDHCECYHHKLAQCIHKTTPPLSAALVILGELIALGLVVATVVVWGSIIFDVVRSQ